MSLKTYYQLTKPGIIYGNIITAAAGFFLASGVHIHMSLLLATLVGMSLAIGSACVFNNYIDRGIDEKMARTKKRALVSGAVSGPAALTYATILGILGTAVLGFYTNFYVLAVGAIAFVDYVALYGWTKRHSVYSTLVGSVSGAAPITAGYLAARGHLDLGALLVFIILVLWQMPHFYSIAMYRLDDYRAAGLPVWPVKNGMKATKIQIMLYIPAFILATLALSLFGYTHYAYAVVMALIGLAWLRLGLKGFAATDNKRWARKMFSFSLSVILVLSVMTAIGGLLP